MVHQQDAEDAQYLNEGARLSINRRIEFGEAGGHGDRNGADHYDDVSSENNDRKPDRNRNRQAGRRNGQKQERGAQQELIRHWIEQGAQSAFLSVLPRNQTVKQIGQSGDKENDQNGTVSMIQNSHRNERNQKHPQQGNFRRRGDSHRLV